MSELSVAADRYFDAIRARDVDAVRGAFAPDAELITMAGTFRGPEDIAGFYRDLAFADDDLAPMPGDYLEIGEHLVVEIELRMAGTTSRVADVFTIVDGLITRLAIYLGPPIT